MSAKEHGITIGRIVIYRSRTGRYSVPAIINCTTDSIDPVGVEAGHVPALDTDENVHLTVFTPGKPGMRRSNQAMADMGLTASQVENLSENVAGCYQEWNVRHDPSGESPGSWRWPERI